MMERLFDERYLVSGLLRLLFVARLIPGGNYLLRLSW